MYSRAGDFEYTTDSAGDIVLARPNGAKLMVEDPTNPDELTPLKFSGVPSSISITPEGEISVPLPPENASGNPEGPGIIGGGQGTTEEIDVDGDGNLEGYTSAQLKLQAFGNPDTLTHKKGGLLETTTATIKSGSGIETNPVVPGQAGTGTLQQGYLEQSNVDMVKEFADMISTQRAYQANSKTITTADELLQTALQLKR